MKLEKYDFSGWATKYNIKCADGRTIENDAFAHQDGMIVPLVWGHKHDDPMAVLGHALLEKRSEGMWIYGKFNDTDSGVTAKNLVEHGDVNAVSIWANELKSKGPIVQHGSIKEVSLVLAGANPGAKIQPCSVAHSDDGEDYVDEAIITHGEIGLELYVEHSDKEDEETVSHEETKEEEPMTEEIKETIEHAEGKTVQQVIDSMTEEQRNVMYAIVGQAVEDAMNEKSEDKDMKHNLFDKETETNEEVISHEDMEAVIKDGKKYGTLKESAIAHGIDNIDYLFPDAKNLTNTPEFIKRENDWVVKFMNGVHKTPFSRIKSMFADITEADARAKGYIKGKRKIEEVFGLLKRTTTPTTIYKKQKLDRDDIIDITDFDVVAWLKVEMRGMLEEEIARAALVGDQRSPSSDDHINEQNVRPIWTDDDLFTIKKTITVSADATDDAKAKAFIRGMIKSRKEYKGSGNPILFTTEDMLTDCLLLEDNMGRVIYDTEEKLRTALRVREIVTVPVMENLTREVNGKTHFLAGIYLNLDDYNIGADKGGAVSMFDDFDIDYNAEKYLMETRCSGALTKPYSAVALEFEVAATLDIDPEDPTGTILGKTVSDIQEGVIVNDDYVEGTLKYVSNWTGYSQDPAENSGNFVVLKFAAPDGATTTLKNLSTGRVVTLDSDMVAAVRVTSKRMKIEVTTTTTGGDVVKKILSFAGLTLLNA